MINKIIEQLQIRGKLKYLTQYGSHLYGLDTENSDLDYRGIFVPYEEDVLLKRDKDEFNIETEVPIFADYDTANLEEKHGQQIETKKVDIKLFSLLKFIRLCSSGDTNALDILFSLTNSNVEHYGEDFLLPIYEKRRKLINTNSMKAYSGYALSQAVKYGIKGERLKVLNDLISTLNRCRYNDNMQLLGNPPLESVQKEIKHLIDHKYVMIFDKGFENKGGMQKYLSVLGTDHQLNLPISVVIDRLEAMRNKYAERTKSVINGNDYKALSHALRCLYQLKELLATGNIFYPLKEREFLKDIKLGKVDPEGIKQRISEMLEEVDKMGDPLCWKYDAKFWNSFILEEMRAVNDSSLFLF